MQYNTIQYKTIPTMEYNTIKYNSTPIPSVQ